MVQQVRRARRRTLASDTVLPSSCAPPIPPDFFFRRTSSSADDHDDDEGDKGEVQVHDANEDLHTEEVQNVILAPLAELWVHFRTFSLLLQPSNKAPFPG